jgi:hypothetical protein
MSIAAEKLPLPHRCRDGFQKMFQISLPRLYWTRNIGTRPLD